MTGLDGITFRRAVPDDLPTCEAIWREALNEYLIPLGQREIPPDNPSLRQLHAHLLATDPDLFLIATRRPHAGQAGPDAVVGFSAAARRGSVWFLSMLFVRPGEQLGGVGRALLERILPTDGATISVTTDAVQPISNGLYASAGMASRLPMFNLVGRPTRPDGLVPLPDGIVAGRIDATALAERDHVLDVELNELDLETLGYDRLVDHDFIRRWGRICFTFRDHGGRLAGYGYTSKIGRLGPVAVRDAAHLAPVVAHLLGAVPPRGASAIWVTGLAGPTMGMLIRAGLRIEGFPVLLGWSRPFAAFDRYVPTSPGLL